MSKRALAGTLILLSTVVSFVNTADAQIGTAQTGDPDHCR